MTLNNPRNHKFGFSLIQLSIVIGILIILMTLSLGNLSSYLRSFFVRAELDKIHALFFFLQQKAIAGNQQEVLTFNVHANSYGNKEIFETLPQQVNFDFVPGSLGPPSKPTTSIQKAITFVNERVLFYPDGTFSAGTIYLTDRSRNAMYALTNAVSPICMIRKYRYNRGSWDIIP